MANTALEEVVNNKLCRWAKIGGAPEYFALPGREPTRPTVQHKLNRFGGGMGPYVDTRLKLQNVEYINATAIDNLGPETPPFVATMCPMQSTMSHFWSMMWEVGSTTIINLTNADDSVGSRPEDKRERYWPPFDYPAIRQAASKWPVTPRLVGTETCQQIPALYRYSIELLGPATSGGEDRPRRLVQLYWYTEWVDFPESSSIGTQLFYRNAWHVLLLAVFIANELRDKAARAPSESWGVVHCSAGVGRTGTFISLVHMLRKLHTISSEAALDSATVACDLHTATNDVLSMMHFKLELIESCYARAVIAFQASVIKAMRTRRQFMVKADTEYATLYAALLLRLKHTSDEEYNLMWTPS